MDFLKPKDTKQTTVVEMSPEQRHIYQTGIPSLDKFAASTPQKYAGQTYAGFTPTQVAAQTGALGSADVQTAMARAGGGTSDYWLSPEALDIRNNPGIQGNIAAATRPIQEALTESWLPAIRDSAEKSGNFGSSRQGVAEGVAAGRAANAIGDATSNIVSKAYDTNVATQLKALGLLPQTIQSQITGAQTMGAVGDAQQQMEQQGINQDVSNWNFDQLMDLNKAKEILGLVGALPGGTTTTTGNAPTKNPLTSALGGASAGASLGSLLPVPGGSVIGGGLGALLGFLP